MALAFKPDYAEARCNQGVAMGKLGDHPSAIGAYAEAIGMKPDYAEAHYNMGAACAELGRYADAVAAYRKVVAIESTGKWADSAREAITALSTTRPANK